MITIREELPQDAPLVRRVNELAFEQPLEADLVERLNVACDDLFSLVAIDAECMAGVAGVAHYRNEFDDAM